MIRLSKNTLKEMLSEIDKISGVQIQNVAQDLLNVEELTMTALGPVPRSSFPG